MLVRIRSRDGNFRFQVEGTDDVSVLVQQIIEKADKRLDPSTLALSNQPRGGEQLVDSIKGTIGSLGISHGDLLFASYQYMSDENGAAAPEPIPAPSVSDAAPAVQHTLSGLAIGGDPPPSASVAESSSSPTAAPAPATSGVKRAPRAWESVKEPVIDRYWEQRDGKIPREKGQGFCRCGPKQMCDYCTPLEPYDSAYHDEHGFKHLSYHAYLRKLAAGAPISQQSNSSSYLPPLTEPSYRVQVPCTSGSHPSWPAGICTKCQPSAVTLSRQPFRMVDHVEFAKPEIIDGMLAFWRRTGTQRFGFMLGRYEPYDRVPMGIKAVVEAVHEPPQEPMADGLTVGLPWEDADRVERLAQACGLEVVGMIFTDLTAETSSDEAKALGKVVAKRHVNSFFLSSLEVCLAAALQRERPTPSRFSDTGKFSSRFVTCVISGDHDGMIQPAAFQVSDQAMAMADADMIEPSVQPGIMRVKEEGPTRYIPDVFYKYKNNYGLEVKESAKPCFPVEYLLVNCTHGFPTDPKPRFTTKTPFAHENRPGVEDQSLSTVCKSFNKLAQSVPSQLLGKGDFPFATSSAADDKGKGKLDDLDKIAEIGNWFSDWHLLAFLETTGMFEERDVQLMARFGVSKDAANLRRIVELPSWQTFLTIAEEESGPPEAPKRDYPGAGGQPQMIDGFEIPPDVDVPPEVYDAVAGGGTGSGQAASGAATPAGMDESMRRAADTGRVCPHCTFENTPGAAGDCEVCGLPLSG